MSTRSKVPPPIKGAHREPPFDAGSVEKAGSAVVALVWAAASRQLTGR
jgi:hypothetical protein